MQKIVLVEDYLILTCHNNLTDTTTFVTGSISDRNMFETYRWRVINNEVVTTTLQNDLELPIRATNLILDQPANVKVFFANGNHMDLRKENIRLRASLSMNSFVQQGDTTYFLLPGGQTVYIDTVDIDKVARYLWNTMVARNEFVIAATFHAGSVRRTIRLNRYILDLGHKENGIVTHINGDIMDCRKNNLLVVNGGGRPQVKNKVGRPKKVVSEETRAKLSEAHLGKKHSEETKNKIRAATVGQIRKGLPV